MLLLLATLAHAADLGRRVSLDYRDADIHAVLRHLATVGGFDVVIDASVQATVTIQVKDVRLDDALAVLLLAKGLRYELVGDVLTVR